MSTQKIAFLLNDRIVALEASPAARALDLIRERLGLFGTKEGCREGECGSCTVLFGRLAAPAMSYRAVPSCLLAAAELDGCHLVTIEGLDRTERERGPAAAMTPFQSAFVAEGAVQCGFCTPGILMALTGYLLSGRKVTVEGALDSIDGNICRCTGYVSIRRAVTSAFDAGSLAGRAPDIDDLVSAGFLPPYFRSVPEKLKSLPTIGAESVEAGLPSGGARAATLLAGGTDLYIQTEDELLEREVLLVSKLGPRGSVAEEEKVVSIPASLTVEELRVDPTMNMFYPGLADKLLLFASTILRNRATVGGNLVNASPIGDLSVILTAFGAQLVVGETGRQDGVERRLDIEDFFLGYKRIDLHEGEMLKSIAVPKSTKEHRWGFARVAKRERLDIPACSAAVRLRCDGSTVLSARIAFGGVSPVPLYARAASESLAGAPLGWESVRAAADIAETEISPIDDLRGSAEYRRTLARRLLYSIFLELFPEHFEYAQIAAEIGGRA